ncbi:MAG: hypothetical protein HY726_15830 [Candidatus Rokubacteria bacterium]|nr:hypothetical protein [Candidatus Rokubacteria bacterium]
MWDKTFPWVRGVLGQTPEKRPRVEIKRGVREELLILIDGQLASLTRQETLPALKAAGPPVVRALCDVLETGSTEARVEAAWLLGQMGSKGAIQALARVIEGACWRGEPPVVLRRTTEALMRLGAPGIQAFAGAIRALAPDDLTRLLLIRHAVERLLTASPPPSLSRQIITAWRWALTVYLRRLERLDRLSKADKLSIERVVLEAYGVSLKAEREAIPRLIEALNRYPAHAADRAHLAS